MMSYGQKANNFTLGQAKGNPTDFELVCYSNGTDTLVGTAVWTNDIVAGIGFTVLDLSGNVVAGATLIDDEWCDHDYEIETSCYRAITDNSPLWERGDEIEQINVSKAEYGYNFTNGYTQYWVNRDNSSTVAGIQNGTLIFGTAPVQGTDIIPCEQWPDHSECVKWSSLVVGLDNTGTRFNESYTFLITNNDGTTVNINQTPTGGWTAQLNQWVTLFQTAYPDLLVEARCNTPGGCGGLLEPNSNVNFNLMVWRYLNITACPTDVVPVKAEVIASSNPARIGNVLDLEYFRTPEERGYVCYECGEQPLLHYQNGDTVLAADLPICYLNCAENYPVVPDAACRVTITESGCDNLNDPDPLNWQNDVTRRYIECDGDEIRIEYYIPDPGDPNALIEYTLVGDFVDCVTGAPEPEPTGDCTEDRVIAVEQKWDKTFNQVTIQDTQYFINIGFSPPAALPNGSSITYMGQVISIPDGQLFDETPENPNAVTGSISWQQWVQDNVDPSGRWVPGSGADAFMICGDAWVLDLPGLGTLTAQNVEVVAPGALGPDAFCETTINGDQDTCIAFQQIKHRLEDCTYEYEYVIEDAAGNLIPYTPTGVIYADYSPCEPQDTACLTPIGKSLCYGSGGGSSSYADTDNNTDGTFSIGGGTSNPDMKWEVQSPPNEGLGAFTLDVVDCINSGETAVLTLTDANGLVFTYNATGVGATGNPDGSGSWYFTGPGSPASGSGKLSSATLTCGSSAMGEACNYLECSTGDIIWLDIITGDTLSSEQIATLEECPTAADCDITSVEQTVCAAETTGEATIGDFIFIVTSVDCENVVQSQQMYNVSNANAPISGPLLTESCSPEPNTQQIRECFIDSVSIEWTQVNIVEVPSGIVLFTLYYDAQGQLGTPSGSVTSWTSCATDEDFELLVVCDTLGNKLVLIKYSDSQTLTNLDGTASPYAGDISLDCPCSRGNDQEVLRLSGTASITIPAGTFWSVTYTVLEGSATEQTGGDPAVTGIPAGYTGTFIASECKYLDEDQTITGESALTEIIVRIIR